MNKRVLYARILTNENVRSRPVYVLERSYLTRQRLETPFQRFGVRPLWREANSIYTSRLGWGRNILVGNFIEILPDVDGDFKVDWWFRNIIDTTKVWEVSYTQTITGLKAGVSSGKVLLKDQYSLPEYDYWTNFDNENLYNAYKTYGVPAPNTPFTCKHRAGGKVTSPSGQVYTLAEAEWSDTMQYKLPPFSATLSFGERKLT